MPTPMVDPETGDVIEDRYSYGVVTQCVAGPLVWDERGDYVRPSDSAEIEYETENVLFDRLEQAQELADRIGRENMSYALNLRAPNPTRQETNA